MASLDLQDVEKVYPNGHVAVRRVSLAIPDGELLVLVGPSGSGKSTLLRLIAGLETPTRGRILIGGDDVTAVPPQGRDLAMVFQTYALYPHKTVRENLGFGLKVRGAPAATVARRVAEVAGLLQIEGLLDRKPGQLSGGQRQRVAVGRAIVREPRAFLFDEPLSNLDPQLRIETRRELALLHRRLAATMVYVTHDQEEAMTLGDRIAVVRDGAIEQVAPPLEVYRRPATMFVAGFVGSPGMNVLRGRLEPAGAGTRVTVAGMSFDLAVATPGGGRDAMVGIRARDLAVTPAGDADLTARVEVVEPLGSDLLVHAAVDAAPGQRVTVVTEADARVRPEDRIGLRLRRDRIHLFDAIAGRRIE